MREIARHCTIGIYKGYRPRYFHQDSLDLAVYREKSNVFSIFSYQSNMSDILPN